MKVYRSIGEIPYQENSCLTIGTFDGIHLGHRGIIDDLVKKAQQRETRSVLVTFYPHPQAVVQTRKSPVRLLTPLNEKIELLEGLGLDVLLVIPFSFELARMEPEQFVEEILVQHIGIHEFIIGYNHAFGRKRRGDVALLKRLGKRHSFTVAVVPAVRIDNEVISSTRIRRLLLDGQVHQARRFLGRNYTLEGKVEKGQRLGKEFGFPTANLDVIGEGKLVPGDGVYAVVVHVNGERFPGMANIGCKPTLDGRYRGIEVHIHRFSGDLYGKQLKVEFIERIRDEKQFDSVNALVSQIELDRKKSLGLLSKNLGGRNGINEGKGN